MACMPKHPCKEEAIERIMGKISMKFLSDPILYEQKFVCRHITSGFFVIWRSYYHHHLGMQHTEIFTSTHHPIGKRF